MVFVCFFLVFFGFGGFWGFGSVFAFGGFSAFSLESPTTRRSQLDSQKVSVLRGLQKQEHCLISHVDTVFCLFFPRGFSWFGGFWVAVSRVFGLFIIETLSARCRLLHSQPIRASVCIFCS